MDTQVGVRGEEKVAVRAPVFFIVLDGDANETLADGAGGLVGGMDTRDLKREKCVRASGSGNGLPTKVMGISGLRQDGACVGKLTGVLTAEEMLSPPVKNDTPVHTVPHIRDRRTARAFPT